MCLLMFKGRNFTVSCVVAAHCFLCRHCCVSCVCVVCCGTFAPFPCAVLCHCRVSCFTLCHCCVTVALCCVTAPCRVLPCVTVVSLLLNLPLPLAASCVTASVSSVVAAHSVDQLYGLLSLPVFFSQLAPSLCVYADNCRMHLKAPIMMFRSI